MELTTIDSVTMTTREIAELTGKEHRNVMADVRAMLTQLGVQPADFSAAYTAGNGQAQPMFALPKDLTLTLVAGYNVILRKRIIDRWIQLEGAAPAQLSRLELLELALTSERERIALAAQVEAQAPKVAFVDRFVASTSGSKGFREVCKLLRANEHDFREFLLDRKIMYRLNGEWTAHAQHLTAGRLEVKAGTANDHAYTQTKFTPKGVEWVAGEWAKYQLQAAAAN